MIFDDIKLKFTSVINRKVRFTYKYVLFTAILLGNIGRYFTLTNRARTRMSHFGMIWPEENMTSQTFWVNYICKRSTNSQLYNSCIIPKTIDRMLELVVLANLYIENMCFDHWERPMAWGWPSHGLGQKHKNETSIYIHICIIYIIWFSGLKNYQSGNGEVVGWTSGKYIVSTLFQQHCLLGRDGT